MIAQPRSIKISALLHAAMFLIAAFGLPVLLPDVPDPQPMVLTVDILPISEITNVKPSQQPIQKAQKAPVKTPVKEPPKPKEAAPKPQPKPEEPMEKAFDPDEGAEPKEVEKPKEQPEKPVKKEDDFEKMMEDLRKEAAKNEKNAKDNTTTEENKTVSDAPYDNTMPLSLSEEDALRSAYIPCWSAPVGAMNAEKLIVIVRAQYNPDGSLIDVKLDTDGGQQSRYNSEPFFRAAADASLRAVRHPRCNPLKNLPPTVYSKLKDTKITFDPRLMAQ